ncbi:IgGFc-binding protein-like [Malaclemys terrapin pileata]|uniref:IgGFc-binding protein-like n=1 Tax=Malaclemys terrapin pileata TaxID=2991368 RepID=UPI0023A7E217|nr:IgGFc-binding protein-like [Malaclemys terrapin pileata]
MYDLCHNDKYRKALCEALKAYADACQLEGVRIGEWRQLARCPMECPLENSQYQLCGTACPAMCVDQSAPSSCQDPCVESCQCKNGFVLSQGKCIPQGSCGCQFKGCPMPPMRASESMRHVGHGACAMQPVDKLNVWVLHANVQRDAG